METEFEWLFGAINCESDVVEDCLGDIDFDGLSDEEEFALGTSPLNGDTDGDTIGDGEEVEIGTDPLDPTEPVIDPNATPLPNQVVSGFVSIENIQPQQSAGDK